MRGGFCNILTEHNKRCFCFFPSPSGYPRNSRTRYLVDILLVPVIEMWGCKEFSIACGASERSLKDRIALCQKIFTTLSFAMIV